MEITRIGTNIIVFGSKKTGYIEKRSVEVNLLFSILEKLEEIRRGIIDGEEEIKLKT